MVVDFVKSFGNVYGTQVRGTTAMNVAIDNISHCIIIIILYYAQGSTHRDVARVGLGGLKPPQT